MKEKIEAWNYYKGYKKVYVESRQLMERIKKLKKSVASSIYYQTGKLRPTGWDFLVPTSLFYSKIKKLGNIVNI